MLNTLIIRNPDLKRLFDEGLEVEIRGTHLLVHHIPYVNANKEIKYGVLVSTLFLPTPDKAGKPDTHVIHFKGEHPCYSDGGLIRSLTHPQNKPQVLDPKSDIAIDHSFSNRPDEDFKDYHEKIRSYMGIICAQAKTIDKNVKAETFKPIESSDPDYVFKYWDANSSRAEIIAISSKLENLKIAIVGLGGTGSYVLDAVAKTPVRQIHLFDGDDFFVHNAFRSPGATHCEQFAQKKVNYFASIYSNMHKYIIPHDYFLDSKNLEQLAIMNFAFVCIDDGPAKKVIIESLIKHEIPFVDTGIGIEALDNALGGLIRLTTGTKTKHDHLNERIGFKEIPKDDYSQNIQIAELNSLNAALAVIKWKKLFGFYHDEEKEHNTIYDLNVNKLLNNETVA